METNRPMYRVDVERAEADRMSMSDPQEHKTKAEPVTPVTVGLPVELRTRLDYEAVRRSVVIGRPVSRSSVARELLEAALANAGNAAA
jgi:hypothetical protein